MKFKSLIFSFILIIIFNTYSCESENPLVYPMIKPVPILKIEEIIIVSNMVIAKATYETPNPCYVFNKTEIRGDDSVKTIKVYAKYYGEPCIQILGTLTKTDTIFFKRAGNKKLRFWISDSTFKDTTLTLP